MKDRFTNTLLLFTFAAVNIFIISCATSKISINQPEMKKVNTIAVMNFDRVSGIPRTLATDCEEAFRGHFIDAGKKVVERNKLASIIKEVEHGQSGLIQNSEKFGQLTGADALLFGSVTQYGERVEEVEYNEYVKNPETKKNDRITKTKNKKFFTFQVQIRLVSTSTGDTILTLKNEYPERSYEMTSTVTLVSFKESVLSQMGKDLAKALKVKK